MAIWRNIGDGEKPLDIDVDALKFLGSAIAFGAVLLSYGYIQGFYGFFRVPTSLLGSNSLDLLLLGLRLALTPQGFGSLAAIVFPLTLLWLVRSKLNPLMSVVLASAIIFSLAMASIKVGQAIGRTHGELVQLEGAGRISICRLTQEGEKELGSSFVDKFYELAASESIRLIHIDSNFHMFAPVLENRQLRERTWFQGEVFSVQSRLVGYCRLL